MKKLSLFIFCFVFWILLVWKLDWENIFIGVVISVFVTFLFSNLEETGAGRTMRIRFGYFLLFFARTFLLWSKSAFVQIYISVSPQIPEPENFEIKLRTSDAKSKAFLIMALNLSPNIIVTGEREGTLLINSFARCEKSVKQDVEKLEKLIAKVIV
ncbi:MAG: Na+/H+ antiporter subunit E [Elusimicrobiota bacterium]|nr:Na+/H+ antiporter subunit E [Elusimicrobiota bacterium]